MDFNDHAGDDLNSSLVFMSSDAYFASHALRSGLLGSATMNNLPLPNSGREAIGREIMKERIREEILAREMVERRILEEEVRREIEMERIMEIRRLQMERWSGLAGTSGMVMHGDRQTQAFVPPWIEAGVGASLGRGIVQDSAEFALRERSSSHLLQKKMVAVMGQSGLRHKLENRSPSNEEDVEFAFDKGQPAHLLQKKTLAAVEQSSLQNKSEMHLPSNKTTTSNCKLSGAKRKAQSEFPIPAEKLWGCALCEVSASSEETLKVHLQGRKHKAKEALLSSNKKTGLLQSKENVTLPLEGASGGGPSKKKVPDAKRPQKFWCGLCKVKCNSSIMMEYHYAGKKHRAFTELKKTNNSSKTEAVKNGANEELGDTGRVGSINDELQSADLSIAP